jgi:hypothetical protein
MNTGFKKTKTYKELKKQNKAAKDKFETESATIPALVACIGGIALCINFLGKVWDWIYKPQETIGWFFLAAGGSTIAIILFFIITFIIGEIINLIIGEIVYPIMFKIEVSGEDNFNKIKREYRDWMDEVYCEFNHYYPADFSSKKTNNNSWRNNA